MCMGMHIGFALPAAGSEVFTELREGDEVTIVFGHGQPIVMDESVIEVIYSVSGRSALTNTGRKLSCWDGVGITKTDRHFEPGEYEVSVEAIKILAEASEISSLVLEPEDLDLLD